MCATDIDIMEVADIAGSGVGNEARRGKGEEKPDGRQEQTALRPIPDMQMEKFADLRMLKEQKSEGDSYQNGQAEQPHGGYDCCCSFARTAL